MAAVLVIDDDPSYRTALRRALVLEGFRVILASDGNEGLELFRVRPPDLVVVEKFGEQEQGGKGLIDEILQTIAAGIPLLISVPMAALPLWQEVTGELGSVIEFNEPAFERWWQEVSLQSRPSDG